MVDQEEIFNKCHSTDTDECIEGILKLKEDFQYLPDEETALEILVKLTKIGEPAVGLFASSTIGHIFQYVHDKFQVWEFIHNLTESEEYYIKWGIASSLGVAFPYIPDKRQAWEDLHRLTFDGQEDIRYGAAVSIGNAYLFIQDKQQAWEDLHRLALEEDSEILKGVAYSLGFVLPHLENKDQAWEDLHRLIRHEKSDVRSNASYSLSVSFPFISDKNLAWEDLHRLVKDEYSEVRIYAADSFGNGFPYLSNKQEAWEDLHKLTEDENSKVRMGAVVAIGDSFTSIPNKQQAWEDLCRLTEDEDSEVRVGAVVAIRNSFTSITDKQQAWELLAKLISDEDLDVTFNVESTIRDIFHFVPNKEKALDDLINLMSKEELDVRATALGLIGSLFEYAKEEIQVWGILHNAVYSESLDLRINSAYSLGKAFPHIQDKKQAWEDLCRLIKDECVDVRMSAIDAIGDVFSFIPDKKQAWDNLHIMTFDSNSVLRRSAIDSIASAFPYIPEKNQGCEDLHRLTNDEESFVRNGVADSIGLAFPYIPNKRRAFKDLRELSKDEDKFVRIRAKYTMGKVSIYRASVAKKEDIYKKELERAIEFFEKTSEESADFNPSQFCLPFYRSFHLILFEKNGSKEKIDSYLYEAKNAVEGSKSKKELLEALEYLVNALKEVQYAENLDLESKKEELDLYRKYCEQAAKLMKNTKKKAPSATEVMRKGLPILDQKLRLLLKEIKEKAKTACQESKSTDTEEIACAVNREVQKWEIGSQEEMTWNIENLISSLESTIPRLLENRHLFEIINQSKNQKDINRLLESASELIGVIPGIIGPERLKPTIGIITALPKERIAVKLLIENRNDKYKVPGRGADREYCLGEIPSKKGEKCNLVLAISGMGNNKAATRATLLLEHFPNVKSIIMVGIAGGIPHPNKAEDNVRLGDIVVSDEYGVTQYDNIKKEIQKITFRNPPRAPSAELLEIVNYLEEEEILGNRPWEQCIDCVLSKLKVNRPPEDKDILYASDNQEEVIQHPSDPKRINGQPRVFKGPIASGNTLLKDPKERDKLRDEFGVKAIEMESSGIADATWIGSAEYLVVRGICDYCDSYKNDDWQQYAAVVAAAYTRALIESMP